jgi:hypothetical protein
VEPFTQGYMRNLLRHMASEQGRADKAKAFASYYAERDAEDAAGLG